MEAKVLAEAEKAFFSCWQVLLPLFVNRQLIPNFLSGFFAVQRIAKLRPNRFQFEVRLASFRCSCKRTLTWCESRASRNCSGKNKNKGSAVDLTAEEQTSPVSLRRKKANPQECFLRAFVAVDAASNSVPPKNQQYCWSNQLTAMTVPANWSGAIMRVARGWNWQPATFRWNNYITCFTQCIIRYIINT